MIVGRFGPAGRPLVDAVLFFDQYPGKRLPITLAVDTGSAHTIIAPVDAQRLQSTLGISVYALPPVAGGIQGIGTAHAWQLPANLVLADSTFALTLLVMEPPPPLTTLMPSLLGRNVWEQFVVVIDRPGDRVELLDPGSS